MRLGGIIAACGLTALLGACSLFIDTDGLRGSAPPDASSAEVDALASDWVDPAWGARRAIVVSGAKLLGEVSGFPLFVDLASLGASAGAPRADGLDIHLTDDDGKTPLPHELVSPRGAWVKLPKLSAAKDKRFYAYYDNPTYAERASGAQVWDGQYEAVWHLDEATAPYRDATSRHQDGSSNATSAIAGQIAGAQRLTGASELSFAMSAAIGITDQYTLSTWFWADTLADAVLVHGSIGLTLTFELYQSGRIAGIAYEGCGSANWPQNQVTGTKKATAGRWIHAALVTNGTETKTYVDGIRDGQRTLAATRLANVYGMLKLGAAVCGNAGLSGRIDEVRLTKRPVDDAWLRAEFESQSSPSTFATVLAEERR